MTILTAEILRQRLSYNQDTGVFTWVVTTCPRLKQGDVAGSDKHKDGYREIGLYGRVYLEHRLAWLYVYGEWPIGHVDHINGVRTDNRIVNLRLATNGKNRANSKAGKNNILGVKGVYKNHNKYSAQIRANGKQYYLGSFYTIEDAHSAYCKAAHEHHGEFARTE